MLAQTHFASGHTEPKGTTGGDCRAQPVLGLHPCLPALAVPIQLLKEPRTGCWWCWGYLTPSTALEMPEPQSTGVAHRCEVWWHLLSCQHTTPVPAHTPLPLSWQAAGHCSHQHLGQLKPFFFQLTQLTPPEMYLPVGIDGFYSFETSNFNCSESTGFKGLPDLMSKPCESAELCQVPPNKKT